MWPEAWLYEEIWIMSSPLQGTSQRWPIAGYQKI